MLSMVAAVQKLFQKVPELEKSTAVAIEKMRLEETARRKLEERLITVSLKTFLTSSVNLSQHVQDIQCAVHPCP